MKSFSALPPCNPNYRWKNGFAEQAAVVCLKVLGGSGSGSFVMDAGIIATRILLSPVAIPLFSRCFPPVCITSHRRLH